MGDLGVFDSNNVGQRVADQAGRMAGNVAKHAPSHIRTAVNTAKEVQVIGDQMHTGINKIAAKIGLAYVSPERPKVGSSLLQGALYLTAAGVNCIPIVNWFTGPTVAGITVAVGGAVAKAKSDNPEVVNDANLALQTTAGAVAVSPITYVSGGWAPAGAVPYGVAALVKFGEAVKGIKQKFGG